jgi:hypothetical protein
VTLESLIPSDVSSVRCDHVFENFPGVFGIVDASPVFTNRPSRHQQQYYSGKFKRHCVKVQALVTPNGQCVHLSDVFRGSMHDKAMLDHSEVVRFLTEEDDTGDERPRLIMADPGYVGIQNSGARAVLPHKRGKGG